MSSENYTESGFDPNLDLLIILYSSGVSEVGYSEQANHFKGCPP